MPELKDFCRLADRTGVAQSERPAHLRSQKSSKRELWTKVTVIDNTITARALRYVTNLGVLV